MEDQEEKAERIRLQRIWYKKLKDSGFVDLEKLAPDGELYDVLQRNLEIVKTPEEYEDTANYFAACRRFFHDHRFTSRANKKIWGLYSEGESYRQIAKVVKLPLSNVFYIISSLREIMKQRLIYGKKKSKRRRKRRDASYTNRSRLSYKSKGSRKVGAANNKARDRSVSRQSRKKSARNTRSKIAH